MTERRTPEASYTAPPPTAAEERAHLAGWRNRPVRPITPPPAPVVQPTPKPRPIPASVQRVIAAFHALGNGLMEDVRARRDAERNRRMAKTDRRLAEMVAAAKRMGIK